MPSSAIKSVALAHANQTRMRLEFDFITKQPCGKSFESVTASNRFVVTDGKITNGLSLFS